jgi:hypothetical protein
MANSRSYTTNNGGDNNAGNTPPPLTLEQVLAMQAQMLQTKQQTMIKMPQTVFNMLHGHQQESQSHQRHNLRDFQRTKPSTFSHSVEPMDVDDWLKIIEKKLQIM